MANTNHPKILKSYPIEGEIIIEFTLNDSNQFFLASAQRWNSQDVIRCYPQDGNGMVTDIGSIQMPSHVIAALAAEARSQREQ